MKIKNDKILVQAACIVVSVAFWVFVMFQPDLMKSETIANIPVTIRNLSALENANLILMNSDKDHFTVNVKVQGTIAQISKLSKGDFSAYIDVLGFSEGITNAKVEVSGPSSVSIVSSSPYQIACNVEGIISKVMDVDIQYEGNQATSYYWALPLSNPSSVKITGPRSIVNAAAKAVATVNISEVADTVVKTVPVRVYDGTDAEIFMSVPIDNVEVTVPVYPTKYVEIIPDVTGVPEEGYQLSDVTVKPDKVRIAARKDILDTVKELKLGQLDISGAFNNILSPREILGTDGLIILDLKTDPVVNAVVEKITDKEFIFKASEIRFDNLKDGLKVIVSEPETEVSVIVTGGAGVINKLAKGDLILSSDVTGADIGVHDFKIQCVTDAKLNNIAMTHENIRVEITEASEDGAATDEVQE